MKLLSPTFLITLAFLQVSVAYLISMEEITEQYSTTLSYFPLLLWLIALFSVALGDRIAVLLFRHRGGMKQANIEFYLLVDGVDLSKLFILYWISIFGLLATSWLISHYAGGIPLLTIISAPEDISVLNDIQANALPGLYGIHAMLIILMEYCLGLLMFKSILFNNKNKVKIIIGIVFVILASLIEGKRQGLVIFIFLCGVIFLASSRLLGRKVTQGYKEMLRSFVAVGLLAFIAVNYVTFVRLDVPWNNDYKVVNEPLRYLSMPLVNLESLSGLAGWGGLELDLVKPFELLLPAKLLNERGSIKIPVPEPTSPSGLFAMAYLFWGGMFGIFIYAFSVGLFSGYMYFKAAASPLFLLFYAYIAWSLLMSHTYNHFLTITFIPLQLFVLLIVKFIVINRLGGNIVQQTDVNSALGTQKRLWRVL